MACLDSCLTGDVSVDLLMTGEGLDGDDSLLTEDFLEVVANKGS